MAANQHDLLIDEYVKYGIAPEPKRLNWLRQCALKTMSDIDAAIDALPLDDNKNGAFKPVRNILENKKRTYPARFSKLIENSIRNSRPDRTWKPSHADSLKLVIALLSDMERPGFKFDWPEANWDAEKAFYLDTMLSNVERKQRDDKKQAAQRGDKPMPLTKILDDAIAKTEDAREAGHFDRPGKDASDFTGWARDGLAVAMAPSRRAKPRAKRIADQRTVLGLTQDQLAARVDVSVLVIQEWERTGPEFDYLFALADALETSAEFIWGDAEFPPSLRGHIDATEHYRSLISAALHMADWGVPEVHFSPDVIDQELDCFLPYELRSSTINLSREKYERDLESARHQAMKQKVNPVPHPHPGSWKDPE